MIGGKRFRVIVRAKSRTYIKIKNEKNQILKIQIKSKKEKNMELEQRRRLFLDERNVVLVREGEKIFFRANQDGKGYRPGLVFINNSSSDLDRILDEIAQKNGDVLIGLTPDIRRSQEAGEPRFITGNLPSEWVKIEEEGTNV